MAGLSKRRGAISVFLLIIFVITYVFMGLLVDAGRYRMAKVYAESALDSATNSLLSNYDRLVFDLYGLFAYDTDAKTEEELSAEIEARYALYLDETLGIAKVDASEYTTQLANTIKKEDGKYVLDVSSLYDFSKIDLEAGKGITLADTKNVESQIIEYMKFRAPIQLVGDMEGFLKKIEAVLSVKDSIKVASEKNAIVDKYENPAEGDPLSKKADAFIKDMNKFSVRFYNFTIDPTEKLPEAGAEVTKSDSDEPYRLMKLAEEFDIAVQDAIDKYEGERREKYNKKVSSALIDLQKAMRKDGSAELTMSHTYAGEDGKTKNFTEMNLSAINENSAELQDLAKEVKKNIGGDESYYSTFLKKYNDADAAYNSTDPELVGKYKESIKKAQEDLKISIANIETNAETMYAETQAMFLRMQNLALEYENYVKEMEAFLEKYKNAYETATEGNTKTDAYRKYQDALTQSGPTIELAKANGGEITRNLELLGNSRGYLKQMAYGYFEPPEQRLSDWIEPYIETVMKKIENPEGASGASLLASGIRTAINSVDNYTNGKASEDLYLNVYAEAVGTLFPCLQGDICTLYSKASYFQKAYYRSDVDVKVEEEIKEKVTEKDVSETGKSSLGETSGLETIDKEKTRSNPSWLNVSYSEVKVEKPEAELDKTNDDDSVNVELETGKVGLDFLSKISSAGDLLMNSLADLMEGARDNLYVDAYVMSMFPNYKDWKEWKDTGKSDLKVLNAPYENGEGKTSYNASYGAVEYVITGAKGDHEEGFGQNSVQAMRLKLFGTRMLFNSLSIMLDSGKITQAQSLSAWAGVLAPLVTVVLLAAWAAMESVIDVMVLMGDITSETLENAKFSTEDGVLVFKKGEDWYFSANGLVSLIAGKAINSFAGNITDRADELADAFEQKANAMIFDAYTSAQESIDAIYKEIDLSGAKQVNEWVDELNGNLKKVSGTVGTGQFSGLTSKLDEATEVFNPDKIKQEAEDRLLDAKDMATLEVSRLTKEAKDKVDEGVKSLGESAKKTIKDNMHKVIPIGKVVNTGTADDDIVEGVRMTYEDYLYFYLFTMDQEVKVQRIQSLVQVNMRVGDRENFSMSNAVVSAWADLECSIKYLFLSNPIVPESMKKDGRLRFKVISAQSY